jgi:hypothetical protein
VIIERDRRTNERIERGGGGATSVAIRRKRSESATGRLANEKKKKNDRSIDRSIQLSPLDAARPAVTPTDLTHTPRHRASGGCRADNRDDADVESRIVFQRG